MEEPNGAKTNLSKCSPAAFAQIFSSISAQKSEQTSAGQFAQIFVIEVVRSVINLLICCCCTARRARSRCTRSFCAKLLGLGVGNELAVEVTFGAPEHNTTLPASAMLAVGKVFAPWRQHYRDRLCLCCLSLTVCV